MDANKLKVLQNLKYHILPVCGLCMYAKFENDWGTCRKHEYDHLKHTQQKRNLSIHKFGTCDQFERDDHQTGLLGKFIEFF
jgi:hypothetical protein